MGPVLRRVIGLGVAAIAPLIMAGSAWPTGEDVQPIFEMHYYNVSGNTWGEIFDSIKASAQRDEDLQGRFEGITSYSVELGPEPLVKNNTCSSDTATIVVKLVVKVPMLTTRNLNPPDQECWAFYDRSLSDHEEWHVQIAVHETQALQAKIRSSSNMSCKEIGQLVGQARQKMIDEQNHYDAVTSHGAEQWKAYGLDKPKESPYVSKVRERCFGCPTAQSC
ncbi:putative secreted Zn-dependent protease [Caballeronia udeis]|jgi:predicted secreted Zn-dependent protease|uniref:Secreted Zn-dependent protease n=1 Tax=Caballeronia udeis TaxID=1232866 RepID=A0ABW8MA81_9BURK